MIKAESPEMLQQRGFNHGYLLARFMPSLAESLAASPVNSNEYCNGIRAGKAEFDKEILEMSQHVSRDNSAQNPDRNKEPEL